MDAAQSTWKYYLRTFKEISSYLQNVNQIGMYLPEGGTLVVPYHSNNMRHASSEARQEKSTTGGGIITILYYPFQINMNEIPVKPKTLPLP